jgi:hypothetical protein
MNSAFRVMRIICLAVLLLGFSPSTRALDDYPAKFILFACNSPNGKLQLACETYISGAQAMTQMLYTKGLSTLRLCPPAGASLPSIVAAWNDYLKLRPELTDKPAIISLSNAIHQSFPCE